MTSRAPWVLARPMRCSTVTPGKLATFWRKPVSLLKSVDFPEFGGPTIATTWGVADWAWNGCRDAAGHSPQSWQALMRCPAGGLTAPQSHGAGRFRNHRRERRAGRLPERCAPELRGLQAETQVP